MKLFKCCSCCFTRCVVKNEHKFPCPSHQKWSSGMDVPTDKTEESPE